jgi:hypothetical protein
MHDIVCPHCHTAFKIDESGYADIVKQVRDSQFEQQLHERLALAEENKRSALELARSQAASELQKAAAAKDADIAALKAKLDTSQMAQQLAVTQALSTKETEILALKAKLEAFDVAQKLALTQAVSAIEKQRDELKNEVERVALKKQLDESWLKDKYETQLKDRDEAIERLRDMKARLSTKMIGETLEQHCENEFNRVRAMAFPQAHFEKDNDARNGSKGDYVFKDTDETGTEIVSIMFEMKNEVDTTATKKKNEDFLKELDKDRTEKGCEYAVLVSLLEPDSELYNTGIVDMFHRYPKMYVVRPQFFLPMITLLRNAAMNSLKYKTEQPWSRRRT